MEVDLHVEIIQNINKITINTRSQSQNLVNDLTASFTNKLKVFVDEVQVKQPLSPSSHSKYRIEVNCSSHFQRTVFFGFPFLSSFGDLGLVISTESSISTSSASSKSPAGLEINKLKR